MSQKGFLKKTLKYTHGTRDEKYEAKATHPVRALQQYGGSRVEVTECPLSDPIFRYSTTRTCPVFVCALTDSRTAACTGWTVSPPPRHRQRPLVPISIGVIVADGHLGAVSIPLRMTA